MSRGNHGREIAAVGVGGLYRKAASITVASQHHWVNLGLTGSKDVSEDGKCLLL